MKKKKRGVSIPQLILIVTLVFGGNAFLEGVFFSDIDRSGEVLGLGKGKGKSSESEGDGESEGDFDGVDLQMSGVTPYVYTEVQGEEPGYVTPTIYMTEEDWQAPVVEEPKQEDKKQEWVLEQSKPETQNESKKLNVYRTEKSVELVPVTERSVVHSPSYVAPVVTKSVLKVIQKKFEQVGKGEILSKPKPTPTPIAISKTEDDGVDVLSGDVDIFYRLSGDKVVLGAQNADARQLKIKEEDLRSAEITLNKVLDKKGVRLSLTNSNRFALVQNGVITVLDMPIFVNIDSHKVYLETAEGKKELKILPLQAVKEAVDLKTFEKLNDGSVPTVEVLGEELAYKVVGDKTYKLFGKIPVTVQQNVYITAESGEVIEGEQPLATKIVRLISL